MDYCKTLRYQFLHGSIARRAILRTVIVASVLSMFPLLQMFSGRNPGLILAPSGLDDCGPNFGNSARVMIPGMSLLPRRLLVPFWGHIDFMQCRENVNLTISVVRELIGRHLLDYGAKTLCAGEGSGTCVYALQESGFFDASGVYGHPFFSLKQKRFLYELDYENSSFDFVFSRDLEKVSVPALLVLEIERVLKPGGIGAMLVRISDSNPDNLIRSATPVSSLLKASKVVHVSFMKDYALGTPSDFTLVVFKRKFQEGSYFAQFPIPTDCPAIVNNKVFMDFIEPLYQEKPKASVPHAAYLPGFMDINPRKRLVYIDIGVGEHMNSSFTSWFPPSYPIDTNAFKVYFVDHNTSVLSSFVKKPGITFIYHPALAENKDGPSFSPDPDANPYVGNEGFDLLTWFKETVSLADFVVLEMNTRDLQLKFLSDLFISGAICSVDELFLNCADPLQGLGSGMTSCMDMFKELRRAGVYVHQWWA
ncbi:hypothetical protein MLD38_035380 [Melastoma candidum]|uniref:Uncharacterized protein n=1 Tax=Melastoma candidum TaxID=119954 RepID=A0ACB9LI67_9MYRT|nr:hypothetical protein MLD38_035380 [Melastoma candidum]